MSDEGERKRAENFRVIDQAARDYDQVGPGSLSYFGQRLVDVAEILSGAKMLDVAVCKIANCRMKGRKKVRR